MFYVSPTGLDGFTPSEITLPNCINRSGAAMAKGDVVMLDLAAASTELTTSAAATYLPGGTDTVWNTVIAPTAVGIAVGILGVVSDPDGIADNASGRVTFYGVVDAYTVSASGVTPGTRLTATTTKSCNAVLATNERVIAIYNAPQDAAITVREVKQVFFDGVGGFGVSGNIV